MSVKISLVEKNSIADRVGIKKGDQLLTINGNPIFDVLDFRFYGDEKKLLLGLRKLNGKLHLKKIESNGIDSLGLNFDTYLMDKQKRCKNNCIFCFIDQLPKGLRESLYFKDDDSRLSFLFGNYITLTNLTEREIDRIIKMHITPVNVSIHSMNPDLRVKMMQNKAAGKALKILKRFVDAGINLNVQLVVCPNINDGDELRYSLDELNKLAPCVESIAVVPVGITKYRQGLYPLSTFNKKKASEVISIINEFNDHYMYFNHKRIVFASDEFYLLSELDMPDYESYDVFPQLENGVGLWALLKKDFLDELNRFNGANKSNKRIGIITGEAAYPLLAELSVAVSDKHEIIRPDIYPIRNDFFGHTITVAGLITGEDIINQMKSQLLSDEYLIPTVMLKSPKEHIFLDNKSINDIENELNIKITPVNVDGAELLRKILGY